MGYFPVRVRGEVGGVGGLGGVLAAGPGRTIYSRGGNGKTLFLRMQIRTPQLSRRLRQITGGTMFLFQTGREERILRGRGRRRTRTKSARGEVDAETTRAAMMETAGIHTDVIGLSVPGGRK